MNTLDLASEAKSVLNGIHSQLSDKDPEKLQIVAQLLYDTVSLQSQALAGVDVTDKLKEVYASTLNLADADRQVAVMGILNFAQGFATRIVMAALTGAAV